jgi:hypothetical protein
MAKSKLGCMTLLQQHRWLLLSRPSLFPAAA